MHIGMLVVPASADGYSYCGIHCACAYDMIAHIYRAAVHRSFFTRGVKKIDHLPRTRRYTSEIADVACQTDGLRLHGVIGKDKFAVMVIE